MSNPPHRIRRLRYWLSTSSQTEAFALRKYLHDRFSEELLPVLESVFDEIANGDRVIHIPKLELHLKVTAEQELMEVLPELIQQQLKEQLQGINWPTIPTTQPEVVGQEATSQENQFATLVHYLQTGSVMWEIAHVRASEIAVDLRETYHQQRSQLLDYLRHQNESLSFYFRLLQLIPVEELPIIVNTLSERISHRWRTAVVELITSVLASRQSFFNRHTQLQLTAAILSESCNGRESNKIPDFAPILDNILSREQKKTINDFIASLPTSAAILFEQKQEINPKLTNTTPETVIWENQETEEELNAHKEQQQSIDPTSETVIWENQERKQTVSKTAQSNYENVASLLQEASPYNSLPLASKNGEFPLMVKYAGLVLLNPFITRFLENTGIKETEQQELSGFLLPRAAALLHFLATGSEEVYEYELGFIKLLLGLQPEMPLLVSPGLIEARDMEECENLLSTVLSYWKVLKSTSVSGLRSSFLQRQGLLRQVDNGWQIQIEPAPFDMLLDYLPWSISVIKLPWMKRPIYTEWRMP
ncbi:contractile injection system tape measure protein [Crocosphaera sp.]|uniref:contractile injection system tape measure protein n=1 Tax=Crocosphaera sp. TaxID=2729996 RepID=UPI003F2911F5